MASAIFIILSAVVVCSLALTENIRLSFNTSHHVKYFGIVYYYSFEGDTVALTCSTPENQGPIGIATIKPGSYDRDYNILVENGFLLNTVTVTGKYSFESSKQTLIIRNLTENDSLYYTCWYDLQGWCYSWYYGPFWCFHRVIGTVYLSVRERSNSPMKPNFCDLISSMDGTFFSGEDLILRCPVQSLNITAYNSNYSINVNYDCKPVDDGNFYLLTIKNLTEKFNKTMLSCVGAHDGNEINYCKIFPNISVFNDLTVTVTPADVTVENGGNVTFTCQSHPFLHATSFEWDILNNNVSFRKISGSDTINGRNIWIENVDFRNVTNSSFIIVCRAATRSKNSTTNAIVRLQSTFMTTITSHGSGKTKSAEETPVPGNPSKSTNVAVIVVPVIVFLLMIGILIFGIFYIKILKKTTDKAKNMNKGKEDNLKANETIMVNNLYDTGDIRKAELGLTENDSEVIYNVAYVSYDGEDK